MCDKGHPYGLITRLDNIAFSTSSPEEKSKKEQMLNVSYFGCDCDRTPRLPVFQAKSDIDPAVRDR